MQTIDLKNKNHFSLYGSDALNEAGYNRFNKEVRENIKKFSERLSYLTTQTAGINARFSTNSKKVVIYVELDEPHHMAHMAATGACGVDIYVYDENDKRYNFITVTNYDISKDHYEITLINHEVQKHKRLWINLPLYIGVKKVELSFDDDAYVMPDPFDDDKRIVIYGTSITQGACASRPGMAYTNILTRQLNTEILNLGFSGSAKCEEEIAYAIRNIENQKLFIIDVEPNAGSSLVMKERLERFIEIYQEVQPNTPIIISNRIPFALDKFDAYQIGLNKMYKPWLKNLVKKYQKNNKHVFFMDLSKAFPGNFTEYTVDGIHPTDLGMHYIAKAYYKSIKSII